MILKKYVCTEIFEWDDKKKEYVRTVFTKRPYNGETNRELSHELCEMADIYDGSVQYKISIGTYTDDGKYCYSKFVYAI